METASTMDEATAFAVPAETILDFLKAGRATDE